MNPATPDPRPRKQPARKPAVAVPKQTIASNVPIGGSRNLSLDALRGLAILLMVLDHICWLFGDSRIAPDSLRILTRLSMPLFCVLTGYLALAASFGAAPLAASGRGKSRGKRKPRQATQTSKAGGKKNGRSHQSATSNSLGLAAIWNGLKVPISTRTRLTWLRLLQICMASCLLNFVLSRMFDPSKFEILASLVLCYLALAVLGYHFCWLALAWLLFPIDASSQILDYPLSAVATCMAVGALMQFSRPRVGVLVASLVAGVLAVAFGTGATLVTPPTVYVLFALPIAALLVACGITYPVSLAGRESTPVPDKVRSRSLSSFVRYVWMPLICVGQYPLQFYVAHYLILLGISAFTRAGG